MNAVVHNYAILPSLANKYTCKKEADCKCEGDMCSKLSLEVSGGTSPQESADCKMAKTFKFMTTLDLTQGKGDNVYHGLTISTPLSSGNTVKCQSERW